MSRAFAVIARTVRALLAFAALTGFTAGVPWLLIVTAGWPLDWIGWPTLVAIPTASDLHTAVTSPWSDQMVLALLATIGWLLWAQFLRDTIIEIVETSAAASATRRGQPRPPASGRGPIRWVAAVLVGAIAGAVLFDAARTVTSPTANAAAADAAARRPAVTVTPAHTDTPQTPQQGPRPALTVTASATSTALPLSAHRDNPAVPVWARHAPGGTHQVVVGDNLWDLAATHLGDPYRWREIYKLNRGHEQPNGYALTDPDHIHVGWILALPARQATPATDAEAPAADSPGTSTPEADETARPEPAISATPAPSSPEPSASTPRTAEPSATADTAEADAPQADTDPADDEPTDQAGITLPTQGWISLGLAAAIAAVAGLLRLQRRRRARLTFPTPASLAPQPSPMPPSLAEADTVGSRNLGRSGHDHQPAVPAPVGLDADAAEVSLFQLPGPGIALLGDGAIPAARAVLAAVLTTNVTETAALRPVVVTTSTLLHQLLPEEAPAMGLDPDGTAYDGERLIVLADTAAAVTHAEEEMIGRRRLLDTFDANTITDLNTRTDHAETQPPYVLLIESASRHAARLQAVATHRAALDLHPVILGDYEGIHTVDVAADGITTGTGEPYPVTRLSTLGADGLAAILSMLTDALARPEAGTDVDDPPAETSPAAATIETTEPVPVQPDDAPALAQLRVLGPVTVATEAGPIATGMRTGSYTVLALLAAHPAGRTLDQLAAALHPDADPSAAVKRVRTDITSARRVLRTATGHEEPMFIVYDPATGRYQLDHETVTVDLWQMLTAINQATTATDEQTALAALRHATGLYAGDFAEGHDHTWATDYATSYRHQILAAHARIAEILETDHPDQAVAALERAANLDPVNEELYQRIMRIHGRQHRPDAVRRTLRRLEERLADLGDAEPSQATRRVAERQLRPTAPVAGTRP
ncbi:BTAD domain-containing putative transcriptional regulator [Solwaraspora sp. WMMD791]|uniref:BTAD domain-containing putative transcriptional regulator n=1 Tax=Solwaraspora sp. WMMD791 TaxID=3016086 RepID=UPI00249C55B6|nr:BTAD domain-containing putative transcriptional regulator [Solwaraspora sp. WMMD791]WFE27659.1 BTAD domain-containing putative transcriptional regulator [Solwaraspora sp. WMMD791]